MATKYRTDYQIHTWESLHELSNKLNKLVNEGWRVDNHKLSGDHDRGWTIFSKTVVVKQELSSCEIPTKVVWDALNSTEFYTLFELPVFDKNAVANELRDKVRHFISDRVKTFCKRWTDEDQYMNN